MVISSANRYTVEISDTPQNGSAWIVRVYQKRLLWKRVVMSDWFLNKEQAAEYAQYLSNKLKTSGGLGQMINRKPGWVHGPPLP